MLSALRAGIVMYEYLMSSEMTQVNGVVFIQDFTGVGPKLLSKFMNKEMSEFKKKWMASIKLSTRLID